VVGEAQGDETNLQKFLKDINQGPKHAHVVKVEKSTIDPKEGEFSFENDRRTEP
jgi:acylphosphatase